MIYDVGCDGHARLMIWELEGGPNFDSFTATFDQSTVSKSSLCIRHSQAFGDFNVYLSGLGIA
jgi:hypothetical protein